MKGTRDSHLFQAQHQAPDKRELPYALKKTKQTKLIISIRFLLNLQAQGEIDLFLFIKIISTGNKGNRH